MPISWEDLFMWKDTLCVGYLQKYMSYGSIVTCNVHTPLCVTPLQSLLIIIAYVM